MRKILMLTTLLLATPVAADEYFKLCVSISEFAERAMKARQDGVELPQQLEIISSASDRAKKIMKPILMGAYKSYRYSSDDLKLDEVKRYKEKILIQCLDS